MKSGKTFKDQCISKMAGMRATRQSWWLHWQNLAEMYLPRRYRWLVQANNWNRGSNVNGQIIDETGVIAARVLAAGMMSGMTSPTKPWFMLDLDDQDAAEGSAAKVWLSECARRMMKVMQQSNLYQSLGMLYHDNGVFCSAAMLIYEDPDEVIRCFNPCLGEFFFGVSSRGDVDTLYREFVLTVDQIVEQFGFDNCSETIQMAFKAGGSQRTTEYTICHGIEPNSPIFENGQGAGWFPVAKNFKYREMYWEQGSRVDSDEFLKLSGYTEKAHMGARWDVTGNDPYGSKGPGIDALPAVRALQIQQRRKAEAIDKMVRPPMVGSASMKNEPSSILPGAMNYVADMSQAGFKPAFLVDPRLAEMIQDIQETQSRVNSIFFADLFLMISQLDTVRTATEIDTRREEKLIQLGPVLERFENEVLDPIINRVFSICSRRGLFPPPPQELQGKSLSIKYISMLAEAQRAAATTAIERLLQVVGNVSAIQPVVLDKINFDEVINEYADALNVDPRLLNAPEIVAQLRQQRQAQAEAQSQAQVTAAGVEGAQTLSKTDLGGGQNALSMLLNGPAQGAA